MEKVRPWCGQPSDRGRLRNRTDMGRKVGELGPLVTQCRLSPGLPPYQVTSWSIRPFGHNRRWPIWGCAHFFGGGAGAGCPSNALWPGGGLSPHQVASWSIQPFGHNTRTSQTEQDRQTDKRWPKIGHMLSRVVWHALGLPTINWHTKVEICNSTSYEDMKGNTKCRKWGGLG